MRSMWNGAVRFGMVSVPVRVYAATEDHDIDLHQVHVTDGGRIHYRRECEVCGPDVEIPLEDVGKGYATNGEVVVLTPEMLAQLKVENTGEITVSEFVPADQVDPLLVNKSYYLTPGKAGAQAYALLRAVLVRSERVAIARIVLRCRESLAMLLVRNNVIVLQTLRWPDEVRPTVDLEGLAAVAEPAEDDPAVAMGAQLIGVMAADFDPAKYTDEHARMMRRMVAKLEATGLARRKPEPAPLPPVSADAALMDQLAKSVAVATHG